MTISNNPVLFLLVLALLLLLQAGFLLFETGSIREKNAFNTAMKNLSDIVVAVPMYLLTTETLNHLFFSKTAVSIDPDEIIKACYCVTCVTICSGAIAERFNFRPYLWLCAFTAGITYPFIEFFAWNPEGPLFKLGFHDRAGSGVVHLAGGMVALAAALRVGPRLGRFAVNGGAHNFPMSNVVHVCLGTLLMVIGWFGFNISSLDLSVANVPEAATHIFLSCMGGGAFGLYVSFDKQKRIYEVSRLTNSILAGLVATTASFDTLSPTQAALTGFLGAGAAELLGRLVQRARVDDAVNAIAVHCGGGAVGILVTGLLGDFSLSTQAAGLLFIGTTAFLFSYLFLWALNRTGGGLRTNPASEEAGLNLAEHGAPALSDELASSIQLMQKTFDFSAKARVEPYTTVGAIAAEYNRLLEKLNNEFSSRLAAAERSGKSSLRIAALVHDLRSPLHALKGEAYILSNKQEIDKERIRKTVDVITHQCNQMNEIIDSVLSPLKPKTESIQHKTEPEAQLGANWNETFARVKNLFKDICSCYGIDLEIPRCGDRESAQIELIDLVRVISNLVQNAIDSLSQESDLQTQGKKKRIAITLERSGINYSCKVADNGAGISDMILPRLFEPFLTTRKDGHGVGLAACKELVHSSTKGQGDLWLESAHPAIFCLRIPAAD